MSPRQSFFRRYIAVLELFDFAIVLAHHRAVEHKRIVVGNGARAHAHEKRAQVRCLARLLPKNLELIMPVRVKNKSLAHGDCAVRVEILFNQHFLR